MGAARSRSSSCCLTLAGDDEPDRAVARSRRSGPGMSPTRCSSCRSRRTPGSGSISAAAAGFPGWSSPARWRTRRARMSIWSRATQKKAAFLRECARRARRCRPLCTRSESRTLRRSNTARFDVVTARALAPLDKLLGFADPLLKTGAIGLFPKGQDVEAELTAASKSWKIDAELIPSKTDPTGESFVRRARLAKR